MHAATTNNHASPTTPDASPSDRTEQPPPLEVPPPPPALAEAHLPSVPHELPGAQSSAVAHEPAHVPSVLQR